MTSITHSLISAVRLLLTWENLNSCKSEDELCTALMGAFVSTYKASQSIVLLQETSPPSGFDKRLDLYLLPSWPPMQEAVAVGEIKFFRKGVARDYRTRIGCRLSDIHYVHSLAKIAQLHGFFFDVVLDHELVGEKCYSSLKKMCSIASYALYDSDTPVRPCDLKTVAGLKSFAGASIDRTPRKLRQKTKYGFIFPPMDLPGDGRRAKRGPAFIKAPRTDGLIGIGVRQSGKEQTTRYRKISLTSGASAAVCFAVFEPGGKLSACTDTLLEIKRPINNCPTTE